MQQPVKNDKKVEYLELIYDLIFVFVIGRNNSLLHITDGGFVSLGGFVSYVVCTLAVIQIWNFTTYYINILLTVIYGFSVFLIIHKFGRAQKEETP